ncbi:MAG: histidine kinase [Acidobacteriaceae bacterium]|nr:histidine kinase [Acidobacteriaceae bacterium]MBV9033770.1 histidine kinase [Acidobacteriaceae bacterium]MBV9309053.1 histidine kinase [Acidobacteriaceae bacterium]MBV9675142.1 histidine kinase [Acidobacteriaceae bacterium]MBV9938239.1 histidine kinase [Acidobacteriaceae bacterium]
MASNGGKLKIFLGYAAGVGKTYQMLEEAQSLRHKGIDVAIGYFEPHGRKDTIAKTEGLEMVPRKRVEYRGSYFEEMDAEAIVARHPQVAVVDEFPHTNVPGSPREKRWEDVLFILEHGISVLTTMNVQHLESLNDQMAQITGVKVRETIPDWVVKKADEVVMVDLTPRALLNRLERGVVYPPDKAQRALQNFFKESTLVALREMALRQTAHEVEERIEQDEISLEASGPGSSVAPRDRRLNDAVIIYVSDDPSTAMLIRRGKRVADVTHADCFAVFVAERGDLQSLPAQKREAIERHLNFARNLHIETRVLSGSDHAQALVDFARGQKARQIFLPRLVGKGMERLRGKSLVNHVVSLADDMEVTIVADRRQDGRTGK